MQACRKQLLRFSLLVAVSLAAPGGARASDPPLLLVGSGGSDAIIAFDERSGESLGELVAEGSGGLLEPDALSWGPDGQLYVSSGRTPERSAILRFDGDSGEFPGLPSEVLRFDIETGHSEVFIAQPAPSASGLGYVSLLGLVFGPDCGHQHRRRERQCDLFVSDFGNDIRRYDRSGQLLAQLQTSYTGSPSQNAIGALALGAHHRLYTVGFDQQAGSGELGAVLRFDALRNQPRPRASLPGALFVPPTSELVRPIGVLSTSTRPRCSHPR